MDTVGLVLRSQLLRDAVRIMLSENGFVVALEASDGDSVLEALRQTNRAVDFVIVDAAFCDEEKHLSKKISEANVGGHIVVLSNDADLDRLSREDIALAAGIITCDITSEAMIQALRLVKAGERVVGRDIMKSLMSRESEDNVPEEHPDCETGGDCQGPSPREVDILKYLLNGCTNKDIARGLGITEATVKVHLKCLLRKIRAGNRTQAAIWAANNGLRESYTSGQ